MSWLTSALAVAVFGATLLTLRLWWPARTRTSRASVLLRVVAVAAGAAAAVSVEGTVERSNSAAELLVLADVSASVTAPDLIHTREFLTELAARNHSLTVKVLPFSGKVLVPQPQSLAEFFTWLQDEPRTATEFAATELAPALGAASAYAHGHPGVSILLITDGHTSGALSLAKPNELGAALILHPLAGRPARRRILDFTAGHRIHPGTELILSARVAGGAAGAGGRVVFSAATGPLPCSNEPTQAVPVKLPPNGQQAIVCRVDAVKTEPWEAGLHQLSAQLITDSGEIAATSEVFIEVEGGPGPLLVDVPGEDQKFWREALSDFGEPLAISSSALAPQMLSAKRPIVVLDGTHLQLAGAAGAALINHLVRYLRAGGRILALQGAEDRGLDILAAPALELAGVLPLAPLSDEEQGRQALAALAMDVSGSMHTPCTSPARLGPRSYDTGYALATDIVKQTVENLRSGDQLGLYVFAGEARRLLADRGSGATVILGDPQAEGRQIAEALDRERMNLTLGRGTDLCVALQELGCKLHAATQATAKSSPGSLFIVTDAFFDGCAHEWIHRDKPFYSTGQDSVERMCGQGASRPTLGGAVDNLKALGITPVLVLVDPCNAANMQEAPDCDPEPHSLPRDQADALSQPVKNLCYRRQSNELRYAGILPVLRYWHPEAQQLVELRSNQRESLAIAISPSGQRTAVTSASAFQPRCAAGVNLCRDGTQEGRLATHFTARAARLRDSNQDSPLLFQELKADETQRPVAASRTVDRGTIYAVATDPAASYRRAAAGAAADLVTFWRSLLRGEGASRLPSNVYLQISAQRASYHLEVAQTSAASAQLGAKLMIRMYDTKGTQLPDVLLTPKDYLWAGDLPRAAFSGCSPCRLRIAAAANQAGSEAAQKDWPAVKVYADARPSDAKASELMVEGRDEENLEQLTRRYSATRLAAPVALAAAPLITTELATRGRSSLPLLIVALAALLADIATSRLLGFRRRPRLLPEPRP